MKVWVLFKNEKRYGEAGTRMMSLERALVKEGTMRCFEYFFNYVSFAVSLGSVVWTGSVPLEEKSCAARVRF